MPTVPVNATETGWKIATPKNFFSASVTGQSVKANADGTVALAAGAINGSARGLVLENNSLSPNSIVDVAADEVILREAASGFVYLAQNVSVTVNLAGTVGAPGGLDTGAEAASTWYYIWLIFNGTTVAALFSASFTSPVLPAGYTFKALVGAIFNNASSNLGRMLQLDTVVAIEEVFVFTAFAPPNNNIWNLLADAPLTAFRTAVPPIARSCMGQSGGVNTNALGMTVAPCNKDGTVNSSPLGAVYTFAQQYNGTGWDGWFLVNNYSVFVRGGANYNIQYKIASTAQRGRLTVTGFTL